ncbi:unnamed protein product [Prorocentrum cordatum]|uniref:Uncharacterized protein n=1 Tax=Prorocentrum cordatum TaxID=2364126 RepID=A0ABN9VIN2_9DINO|nr:unnamed protein product [Polarella glacialis]
MAVVLAAACLASVATVVLGYLCSSGSLRIVVWAAGSYRLLPGWIRAAVGQHVDSLQELQRQLTGDELERRLGAFWARVPDAIEAAHLELCEREALRGARPARAVQLAALAALPLALGGPRGHGRWHARRPDEALWGPLHRASAFAPAARGRLAGGPGAAVRCAAGFGTAAAASTAGCGCRCVGRGTLARAAAVRLAAQQSMNDAEILKNLRDVHGWERADMGAGGNCLFLSVAAQVDAADVAPLPSRGPAWAQALGEDLGQRWEAMGVRERASLLRRMAILDEHEFVAELAALRADRQEAPGPVRERALELFKDMAEEFIDSGITELAEGLFSEGRGLSLRGAG